MLFKLRSIKNILSKYGVAEGQKYEEHSENQIHNNLFA